MTISPNQNIFGPALGVLTPAAEPKGFPTGSGNLFYANSDTVYDTDYTAGTAEMTYSETNHRATFINAANVVSVARLMTGYGYGNRIFEAEIVVKAATTILIGFRPTFSQGDSGTGLSSGTGDIAYSSNGSFFKNGVTVLGVGGLPTFDEGDKISGLYFAELGCVEFWRNGVTVYRVPVVPNTSYRPVIQGSGGTTHSIRVSTQSSYPVPPGVFYYR